jgi:hypothetical protein
MSDKKTRPYSSSHLKMVARNNDDQKAKRQVWRFWCTDLPSICMLYSRRILLLTGLNVKFSNIDKFPSRNSRETNYTSNMSGIEGSFCTHTSHTNALSASLKLKNKLSKNFTLAHCYKETKPDLKWKCHIINTKNTGIYLTSSEPISTTQLQKQSTKDNSTTKTNISVYK